MPARASNVRAAAGGAPPESLRRVVLWLRNDLRLHDSAIFHRAALLAKQGTCEVPSCPQLLLRALPPPAHIPLPPNVQVLAGRAFILLRPTAGAPYPAALIRTPLLSLQEAASCARFGLPVRARWC